MKRVFSSQKTTADIYAEQSQREGQNSTGTLYFWDNTAYSYGRHFPISIILNDKLAIFNARAYSNTTAKHKGHILRALLEAGYEVIQFPIYTLGYGHEQPNIEKWYLDKIEQEIGRMSRARTEWTRDNARDNIDSYKIQLNKYRANKVIIECELS